MPRYSRGGRGAAVLRGATRASTLSRSTGPLHLTCGCGRRVDFTNDRLEYAREVREEPLAEQEDGGGGYLCIDCIACTGK